MQNPYEEPFLSDKELRRIVRTSLPGGRVHSMANDLLNNSERMPEYDGRKYLDILEGRFSGSRARILAAESLRFAKIDLEMASQAEATLSRIASKRDLPGGLFFLIRVGNLICRFYALALLLSALLALVLPAASGWNLIAAVVMIMCCYVVLPFASIIYDGRRRFKIRRKCASALGRVGGPASVGILLSLIEEGSHWNPARSALRNVLTDLTHEDYGHVGAHTIGGLNKMLLKPFWPEEMEEWIPLLLDTLGKVGNGSSVEAVEKIATKGRSLEWREQASRVLPILLERQKLEHDSSRLLRATTAEEGADDLLRPAGVDSSADKHLLLHAVQDDL